MESVLTLGRGMRKMRAEKPMFTACLEGEEDGEEEEEEEESRILDLVDSIVEGKRRERKKKKNTHVRKDELCSDRSDRSDPSDDWTKTTRTLALISRTRTRIRTSALCGTTVYYIVSIQSNLLRMHFAVSYVTLSYAVNIMHFAIHP